MPCPVEGIAEAIEHYALWVEATQVKQRRGNAGDAGKAGTKHAAHAGKLK